MLLYSKKIDKFIYYSLILLSLSVCFSPFFKVVSLLIFIISVLSAYLTKSYNIKQVFTFDKSKTLLVLFFILCLISVVYSSNKQEAWSIINIQIPLFIIPLAFFIIPKKFLQKEKLWQYSIAFIIGLLIIELHCIFSGITRSLNNSTLLINELTYGRLTLKNHASYLSMYTTTALIITYKIPFKKILSIDINKIKIILYFFFSLFMTLLTSRSGIICLAITLGWIFFDAIKKSVHKKKVFLLALIILTSNITSILLVLNTSTSHDSQRYSLKAISDKQDIGINHRLSLISSTYHLLFESPIMGIGIGDVDDNINRIGIEKDALFYNLFKGHTLNTHNQYYQTAVGLGLIGLITLILIFLFPMIKAFSVKDYFIVVILIVIGFNFIFEVMLQRQAGVHFFAFIYCWISSYLITTANPKLVKSKLKKDS